MYLKKTIFSALLLSLNVFGQVGINTINPDKSSILDINANPSGNNKGVLLPRVSLNSQTDGVTIASPAKGLVVLNTNNFLGEGMYVNEGTPTTPIWQKMKLLQSDDLSRVISSMAYVGNTDNSTKILQSDTFEWRLMPGSGFYQIQARLKSVPSQNIVTTGTFMLFWNSTANGSDWVVEHTWTPANWNIWQTIGTTAVATNGNELLVYFGIRGTEKLFRVNAYVVVNSYNSLVVEQF